MTHRPPAVAGYFYSDSADELRSQWGPKLNPEKKPAQRKCLGLMLPHAGYLYSGELAARAISETVIPERVIILCPNHTGRGTPIAIWDRGEWETPLGTVPIDQSAAQHLTQKLNIDPDYEAHLKEHAIEVQLPLLQLKQPKLQITPIVLGHLTFAQCQRLATALHSLRETDTQERLLLASTDMSHFISSKRAKKLDSLALEQVEALNPRGLLETVEGHAISMCGYIPTATVIDACNQAAPCAVHRAGYTHSGEVTGDFDNVVAYAAAQIFAKQSS